MKLKICSNDFALCSDGEIGDFPDLDGEKGVVALKQYLIAVGANMRQGNACAKNRGEVSGSGKKPYRQKGTGFARHGSKRSPIWSGGGVVFGPKPRDYSQKINRKVKLLALLRALSDKARDGNLCVIEKLSFGEPKTKLLSRMLLPTFGCQSVLFVDDDFDYNFVLAGRNIENVFMVDSASLSALDVVRCKNVVISECAMRSIRRHLFGDAVPSTAIEEGAQ
jgi:large subunit ribosomal protein L4